MQAARRTQEFEKYLNTSAEKEGTQLSDIKRYTQEEIQTEENILKKVSPITNSNGILIVEVDKVVRDLRTYLNSIKQAKFYKVLMQEDQTSTDQVPAQESSDSEQALQTYRLLQNEMFRIIVKLNNGVEQMSKQSEVLRMKLVTSELRVKLQKLEGL